MNKGPLHVGPNLRNKFKTLTYCPKYLTNLGLTELDLLVHPCNDLFSRFEQQILFLEKLSWSTDPKTDRRGGLVPKYLEF